MADYKQAKEILLDKLKFLRKLGFDEPTLSIEKSKLLGDSLLVTYSSVSFQRQIKLGYVCENGDRAAAISVLICDALGERFSLDDWVRNKYLPRRLKFVADQGTQGERAFLEDFSSECRAIFEGPLRNTVTGKGWDGVAFDWKDYR